MRLAAIMLCGLLAAIPACSLPRITVLSDPLTAAEHNDLGVSYEAAGEWDRALAAYAAASGKDRGWDQPLINRGNVHAAMGDWSEAATSFRRALRRNPDNPEAMNNLAYALLQGNDARQARKWSERAVAAAPENVAFICTQALILAETGQPEEAVDLLERTLLKLSPDDPVRPHVENLILELSPAPRDSPDDQSACRALTTAWRSIPSKASNSSGVPLRGTYHTASLWTGHQFPGNRTRYGLADTDIGP